MRNYQTIFYVIILFLLSSFNSAQGADTPNENTQIRSPNIDLILKDIQTLSSTTYEGRQAGTTGGQESANFVIKRLKDVGLMPAGEHDSTTPHRAWTQQESLAVSKILDPARVEFSIPKRNHDHTFPSLKIGQDFLPILDSPSVHATAPIVFVGYGLDDPAHGVNDYEGIHVQNRIVMFLRGKPAHYKRWITHEEKEQTARKHGAVGFITLTGPTLNRYEARRGMGQKPLAIYSSAPDVRPLPGVWISGELGKTLFASNGYSLQNIQTQLNEGKNLSTNLGIVATLQWNTAKTSGKLINVLGFVPGNDPVLREEIILIGAHRDHFGKQAGLLFPGADDNASGTAVFLELARLLSMTQPRPARTIVFASFDGEERGLLGSKLYVRQPSLPLNKIVAMINIDHVAVGNGKLTVGLTRLPKSLGKEAARTTGLTEKSTFYGYFPGGDHVPFYKAKVPTATVVSSGKHLAFHQPSDISNTVQPEILKNATQYILALTWLLANK